MEGLKLQVLCSLGEGDAGQGMGQSGHREDAEERTRTDGKGASSLLHSLQPCTASTLGTRSRGSIKGPLCPRKALNWGADLGNLTSLPNTPR